MCSRYLFISSLEIPDYLYIRCLSVLHIYYVSSISFLFLFFFILEELLRFVPYMAYSSLCSAEICFLLLIYFVIVFLSASTVISIGLSAHAIVSKSYGLPPILERPHISLNFVGRIKHMHK